MSRESVEVVRQPMAVAAHSRRRLEERVALRFPGALALCVRLVWQSRPRSRLRQALNRRLAQLGCEAANRADHELTFILWRSQAETAWPPQMVGVGWDPVSRGREARIDAQRRWNDEWGAFRFEPDELMDLGDRLLMVGRMKATGLSSGAATTNEWALLVTLSAGRVVREHIFIDHAHALEAAGLQE
jgi:ketosteroid isomerase-like protein